MLRFVSSLSALVLLVEASCLHGTSYLARRQTENGTVDVSKFGYGGDNGPLSWDRLSADNILCKTGRNQAPIDIDSRITTRPENLTIDFANLDNAEYENLGSTVEVICPTGQGPISRSTLGNTTFTMKQFHFHSPSEHRIEGEHFPLEMHMVHESADKQLLVLGVLFEMSPSNTTPLLKSLALTAPRINTPGRVTQSGPIDFSPIAEHLNNMPKIQYSGSLTTPPCKEGVSFVIATTPMPIDAETYVGLKKVLKFNARNLQTGLGRENVLDRADGGIAGGIAGAVTSAVGAAASSASGAASARRFR